MLALAKIAIQPNVHPLSSLITPEARTKMTDNAWPVFASMTWASVMYIFRWYPDTLASSLRSSMVYMYVLPRCYWSSKKDHFIPYTNNIVLVMLIRITGIHYGPCSYIINDWEMTGCQFLQLLSSWAGFGLFMYSAEYLFSFPFFFFFLCWVWLDFIRLVHDLHSWFYCLFIPLICTMR